MAMSTLTSITGLPRTLLLENNNKSKNLHDVSFSSYLNNTEETFICKLAESSRNLSPNLAVEAENHHLGRKKAEDGEIGIFRAEKYFNGGISERSRGTAYKVGRKHQYVRKDERNDHVVVPANPKSVHSGTPSVRSESSWNSQNALLQSARKHPSQRKTNKVHGKSFLAGLGCKYCSCSDKESVDVDDYVDVGEISFNKSANAANFVQDKVVRTENIKTSSLIDLEHRPHAPSLSKPENQFQNPDNLGIGLKKENCFTFPALNSAAANVPIKMQLQVTEELKPRKSLEVFGSPIQERRSSKSLSFDKRLSMLSWDATPRLEEIKVPAATSGGVYDDNDSDGSSDLFEIESLTGKVNPFLGRQESDAASGYASPTHCYAPSEASIEWSVVTASAADFSALSDYEETRPPTNVPSPIKEFPITDQKTRTSKDMPKFRPGILGCKSQKAVNVAGDAYTTNDKAKSDDPQMRRLSDSYMPAVTRFQAEAKLTGFDSRPGRHSLATRSLPRPYTSHNSHLLYIQ